MALDLAGEAFDGQMLMAYGGPPDMQHAWLPIEKQYGTNMGPGDRTQALMPISNARLPTELFDLFVYIMKTKYNIWKIMVNGKKTR